MAPTKVDSSLAVPFVFKVLPVIAVLFLASCFAVQAFLPHENLDFVNWKSPKQGLEISKKSGRPILYDFTAEWCGPCHALTDEVLRDKEIAKMINDEFVPVRVVDLKREESANPPDITNLQKKYHVEGFPTLIIVGPKSIVYKTQEGYPGKEKTKKFIGDSLKWTVAEADPYSVNYLHLDDAIVASRAEKKPLLLVFWDEHGPNARYDYLANSELVSLIKSKFVMAEVLKPIHEEESKSPEAKQLLAKLGLHRTPALVIVPVDGSNPHFQIGGCVSADNKEFLEKYLRLSSDKGAK